MKKFYCRVCKQHFGWPVEYRSTGICTYCSGQYADGTKCPGGNAKSIKKASRKLLLVHFIIYIKNIFNNYKRRRRKNR